MSWEHVVGAEEASGPTCSLHRWGTEVQGRGTSLRSLLPRMSPGPQTPTWLALPCAIRPAAAASVCKGFLPLGEPVLLSVGSLPPPGGRTPALHPGVCGEHSGGL